MKDMRAYLEKLRCDAAEWPLSVI